MSRQEDAKKDFPVPLGWLMFFRVIIVSVLLGISTFIQLQGLEGPFNTALYPIYTIIGFTYLISIVYVFLLRLVKSTAANVYIQSMIDLLLITALVHVTGGVESIYTTLYPLVIIYSVPFIERRGGLFVATLSGTLYALMLGLEFFGIIHPIYEEMHIYQYGAGYVFTRIFTNVVSFYVIAVLAIFVFEQERNLRSLLSERENAFNRLDQLHKSIIESVSVGIMTMDLNGYIKSSNRAAELITGKAFSEMRNRHVDEIFKNSLPLVKKASPGSNSFEYAMQGRHDNRTILGFSVHPLMERDETQLGYILILDDHTAMKKMEREVEKNKRLALIGEMTAVLTHELRTPIASITGSIQVLHKGLNLRGTDKKLMDIMLRGKEQLENLVRDFLLIARSGKGERGEINIRDMVDEVIASVRFHPDWNSGIRVEVLSGDESSIIGNRTEIRQALWNVIVNAVQALPEGGTITVEIQEINDAGSKAQLEVSIADTGSGVASEHMGKIMEPFYTTKDTGTGLGLAIVNRVIENHGGKFIIENTPWGGTRCRMQIPREI